jgi:hypothetical protein
MPAVTYVIEVRSRTLLMLAYLLGSDILFRMAIRVRKD